MNRVIPYIVIHVSEPDPKVVKSVMAGIEEEEVLYHVITSEIKKDSVTLAYEAAKQSSLGVGIGISRKQTKLAVQQQLAPVLVELDGSPRNVGHNSAKFVKKVPLR